MLLTHSVWPDISAAAKQAKQPASVAAAYCSKGASSILNLREGSVLVVNASIASVVSGSTSPLELIKFLELGIKVFSCPNLHAKVFAFDNVAFVGSNNISYNSKDNLVEAAFRINDGPGIASVKKFVHTVCDKPLDLEELNYLSTFYVAPKTLGKYKPQKIGTILIMEITGEQGPGRNTQIQPPLPTWEVFFGLTTYDLHNNPTITLLDEFVGVAADKRIVKHDHNFTIEIKNAKKGDIIVLKKMSNLEFTYRLHKPDDVEFSGLAHVLSTTVNPLRTRGRLWIII